MGTYQGEAAWVIAVPKDGSRGRFYKAVSGDSETGAVLYTEAIVYSRGGFAIQSPNGTWWKLKVANSGAVSGEAITPPAWIGGLQ